jgi:4-hydroxybenzoate polyprenyltransferase
MMLLFTAVGDAATRTSTIYSGVMILAAILIGCLFIISTSINDMADVEIDRINLPKDKRRPLVVSETTTKNLKLLIVGVLLIALVAAYLINPKLILLVCLSVFLSYIYSFPPVRISYRGIIAPILLPINYILLPVVIGFSFNGQPNLDAVVLLVGLYISFIGRIILKDFRDVKGDRKYGKKTFLVRHGAPKTCLVAAISWIIGDLIISSLFIANEAAIIILLQLYVLGILYALKVLASEKNIMRQLTLVNIVGRFGNSIALNVLAVFTLRLYEFSSLKNATLIILVNVVNIYTCYFLVDLYRTQLKGVAKKTQYA